MNLVPPFYAALAPWLALSLLFMGRIPHPGNKRILASLLIAEGTLFWPVRGFFLFQWIALLEPNPSFILTGLLVIALWERAGGRTLFRPCDWNATWLFGALAALVLYPMGLGLTSCDPYAWGWSLILPVATAAIATILLLQGNRFGILLLLPLAGFLLHLQESQNFWDALLDPFYGVLSLGVVVFFLIRRLSSGRQIPGAADRRQE
jgi:hypothetical protein